MSSRLLLSGRIPLGTNSGSNACPAGPLNARNRSRSPAERRKSAILTIRGATSTPTAAGSTARSRRSTPGEFAAAKTVRRLPGDQKEQDARQKLCQPHQPQVQRAMRQRIHLPGDCHGLHLRRRGRQHAERQVIAEVGVAKSHVLSFPQAVVQLSIRCGAGVHACSGSPDPPAWGRSIGLSFDL